VISSPDDFASTQDEYYFTTTEFRPWAHNDKTLGGSSYKWSHIYGVDGTFDGDVGIGISAPARPLEVRGPWQTARISSTSAGATLELVSTGQLDWAMTTWYDGFYLISSTDDFEVLTNKTDEYIFTTTNFRPVQDNIKSFGSTSSRWSTMYSVNADIEGYITGGSSTMGGLHVHDDSRELSTLYVTPMTTGSEDSARVMLAEDSDATFGMYWLYDGGGNHMELWGKSSGTLYGPHMVVQRNNGNMAIGGEDFATGYLLSVNGDVICEELRVELVADWPDYVFREEYDLMTLPELDRFIKQNGHLPEVPPAEEIEDGGFEVGEMQKLMMKKIEELSLYVIQQQQEIEELKNELNKIRK
jgi:hypothetical protein